MVFQTRNPYYLRISDKNVLPVYLYLDERHLDWMSDRVFQLVLADIRPHILQKMKVEAPVQPASSSKKATVDTHRGDTYQFCYFFRKNEPHSIVLKARNFVAQPRSIMPAPSSSTPQRRNRKRKATGERGVRENNGKKRKPTQGTDTELSHSRSNDIDNTSGNDQTHPSATAAAFDPQQRNSSRDDSGDEDIVLQEESITLRNDLDEDEKPKLMLQLKYQGFEIYGHCLCIVIEPWPPIRAPSKLSSAPQTTNKVPRIAPTGGIPPPGYPREKTPLFLPDVDQESHKTARRPSISSLLDPRFLDDSDDSDYGGMMEFSQALTAAGDLRAGAADDDEDQDAAMFFGDADEVKEL